MERIKLNLIPSGVAPIVHLSQYDDGRKFGIDLFEGESVYVLDGTETLTVNSRKPDGHVVTLSVTNTGTSSLDVDVIEQLTAVHGLSYAKLQIVKGSVTIATLPFLIDVSRDPLENGDPSESFIQNLRTQIAEGVAEEVANQYDSANVIFDTTPTQGHGNGYAVTSQGIKTALDLKSNTATTYSKTDVDNKINAVKPQIFNITDTLLNVMGGTLRGFGSAMITLSGGIARIDFNLKITVAESTSGINTWGINRDYFTAVTGKTITPQSGGTAIYFDASGNVLDSRTDLGGTFVQRGQFWQPARVYDDNGTRRVGGWASSTFSANQRISGTVYGTYT